MPAAKKPSPYKAFALKLIAKGRGNDMARRRYQQGSVYPREGLWYLRYYESVLLPDETEYRIHRNQPLGEFATRKLAQRAAEPILARINDRFYHPVKQGKWKDFAEQWQKTMLPNYKPSVQASIRSQLKVLGFFDSYNLSDINAYVVQIFIAQRKKLVKNKAGKLVCVPADPKTIKNDVGQMRSMWTLARKWSYVQHDPFDGVVIPSSDEDKPEEPCYSAEQTQQIVARARHPYNLVFWTLGETGIRLGEICGLNCGDVQSFLTNDIDGHAIPVNFIEVRRSRWGKYLTRPKNSKVRPFAISHTLAEALHSYIEPRDKNSPLFLSPEGCRLHPENLVKRVLKPILRELGIVGASHGFRHGNITEMDRMGTPMAVRKSRVGHADDSTTMKYTHLVSSDARITAEALGKLYKPVGLEDMEPEGGTQ
jgi:integrase